MNNYHKLTPAITPEFLSDLDDLMQGELNPNRDLPIGGRLEQLDATHMNYILLYYNEATIARYPGLILIRAGSYVRGDLGMR